LVTKNIASDEASKFRELGFDEIVFLPCIHTQFLNRKTLHLKSSNLVFTSHTAIDCYIENFADIISNNEIQAFVLSEKAAKKLQAFCKHIYVAARENAESLFALLLAQNIHQFDFLCGKTRLNTLEKLSEEHHILVNIIELYQTDLLYPICSETYDAIAFYSPSAYYSFIQNNTIADNVCIYVKGKTTAQALQKEIKPIRIIP